MLAMFPGRGRSVVPALMLVVLGVAAGASACRHEPGRCAICYMVIPIETAAAVRTDDGVVRKVCDPRCALTFQEQTSRGVALVSVTDYESRRVVEPRGMVFVTGSDTALDAHSGAVRTPDGDAMYLHWHRCLPSVIAFSSRDSAARFQQQHGGRVVTFAELGFER